jgi:hypothetical protein
LRKHLIAALVGVLALALASLAYANPVSDTTFSASGSVNTHKAGTKKKPRGVGFTVRMKGRTKSGTGQPETSTALLIKLPGNWRLNGKAWPRDRRCAGEDAAKNWKCGRASVGSGHVNAVTGNGTLPVEFDLTVVVVRNGNLGFFLKNTRPFGFTVLLQAKIKGSTIRIEIPKNVQEPGGLKTAILDLRATLGKSVSVGKGKRRRQLGLLQTTGCVNKSWPVRVTNEYVGRQSLASSFALSCRK